MFTSCVRPIVHRPPRCLKESQINSSKSHEPTLRHIANIRSLVYRTYQDTGIPAYDAVLHKDVLVIPAVLALLGDNPMQSELASHIGLTARLFCRVCWDVPYLAPCQRFGE